MTLVAPHAGAWIETLTGKTLDAVETSLLTQERGLKHSQLKDLKNERKVAPHAGAWIETFRKFNIFIVVSVAPHAGAWIETFVKGDILIAKSRSLLTQERGLKQKK